MHDRSSNSSEGGTRRQATVRRRKIWGGPIALLLVVAALWWQWNQARQPQGNKASSAIDSPAAAAISGVWQGEVAYSWGPTYTERFLFQAEGDKLFGTASFLAFKRGIEDGRIEGDKISFTVRFQTVSEGMTSEHRNRYLGTVSGNQIHFRMQDDRGNPPVEFVAGKENGTE